MANSRRIQPLLQQLGAFDCGHGKQPAGKELSAKIAELQDTIGEDLPEDYQAALPVIGGMGFGAVVFPTEQDIGSDQRQGTLQAFLGFTGDSYDLLTVAGNHEDLLSDGYLPIALDPGGNLICLDVQEDNAVWFWDSETDDMGLVNESFDGFIESLQPRPEE